MLHVCVGGNRTTIETLWRRALLVKNDVFIRGPIQLPCVTRTFVSIVSILIRSQSRDSHPNSTADQGRSRQWIHFNAFQRGYLWATIGTDRINAKAWRLSHAKIDGDNSLLREQPAPGISHARSRAIGLLEMERSLMLSLNDSTGTSVPPTNKGRREPEKKKKKKVGKNTNSAGRQGRD